MAEELNELKGKVAVVTGGASGIGRATAAALARQGATIAILDRNIEGARSVIDEVAAPNACGLAVSIDLQNSKEIAPAIAHVLSKYGRIDILVNNAGILDPMTPLLEYSEADWDWVQAVNLRAPFLLTREVARHMVACGGGGRIVNVTSSSAFRAKNAPFGYAAAKAGLVSLTRSSAAELGQYNINVNAVAPGPTYSGMTLSLGEDGMERMAREGPLSNLLQRPSMPEDVAEAILFLCLPASRQITAQTLHVSAGLIV